MFLVSLDSASFKTLEDARDYAEGLAKRVRGAVNVSEIVETVSVAPTEFSVEVKDRSGVLLESKLLDSQGIAKK